MPASDGAGPSARQEALGYLAVHRVVTLATDGPQGLWAAAVFYVSDGFDLYFLSAGNSRHARNLAANSRAAATIQEDYADWPEIKGIQLEGQVSRLSGTERAAAIEHYQEKYPFLRSADLPIRLALQRVNWYRLRPIRLYFIDNSKGFGHRDEINLLAGESQ